MVGMKHKSKTAPFTNFFLIYFERGSWLAKTGEQRVSMFKAEKLEKSTVHFTSY